MKKCISLWMIFIFIVATVPVYANHEPVLLPPPRGVIEGTYLTNVFNVATVYFNPVDGGWYQEPTFTTQIDPNTQDNFYSSFEMTTDEDMAEAIVLTTPGYAFSPGPEGGVISIAGATPPPTPPTTATPPTADPDDLPPTAVEPNWRFVTDDTGQYIVITEDPATGVWTTDDGDIWGAAPPSATPPELTTEQRDTFAMDANGQPFQIDHQLVTRIRASEELEHLRASELQTQQEALQTTQLELNNINTQIANLQATLGTTTPQEATNALTMAQTGVVGRMDLILEDEYPGNIHFPSTQELLAQYEAAEAGTDTDLYYARDDLGFQIRLDADGDQILNPAPGEGTPISLAHILAQVPEDQLLTWQNARGPGATAAELALALEEKTDLTDQQTTQQTTLQETTDAIETLQGFTAERRAALQARINEIGELYEDQADDLSDFEADNGLTAQSLLVSTSERAVASEVGELDAITQNALREALDVTAITPEMIIQLQESDPDLYESLILENPGLQVALDTYADNKETYDESVELLPQERQDQLTALTTNLAGTREERAQLRQTQPQAAFTPDPATLTAMQKLANDWNADDDDKYLDSLAGAIAGVDPAEQAAYLNALGNDEMITKLGEHILAKMKDGQGSADDLAAFGAAANHNPQLFFDGINAYLATSDAVTAAETALQREIQRGDETRIKHARQALKDRQQELGVLNQGNQAVVSAGGSVQSNAVTAGTLMRTIADHYPNGIASAPPAVRINYLATLATREAPNINADLPGAGAALAAAILDKNEFGAGYKLSTAEVEGMALQMNENLGLLPESDREAAHFDSDDWNEMLDAKVINYNQYLQGTYYTASGPGEHLSVVGKALGTGLLAGLASLFAVDFGEGKSAAWYQTPLYAIAFITNIMAIHRQWKGLGAFFALGIDDEELQKKSQEFDQVFCQELGLAGPNCWASLICEKYPDTTQGRGSTVVSSTGSGAFTYGAHIEAEKTETFTGTNETGLGPEGTSLYKVQFRVRNTNDKPMFINVEFTGADGLFRYFPRNQELDPGSGASYTRSNGIYKYIAKDYDRVCLTMTPGIIDHKGKEHNKICSPINVMTAPATRFEHELATLEFPT